MSVEKQCASCNKPLTGKRSHAITCGSTCRGRNWRTNKEPLIPVKVAFSVSHFEEIKNSANAAGKSINDYVHDHVISERA